MTSYFPVTVSLVTDVSGTRACLLLARGVPVPAGDVEGVKVSTAAASAAAASPARDEVAVTWVVSMERTAWCQAAVKDSSSAVTGLASVRRRARAAASSLRRAAASLARTSWVPASQAQASCSASRGQPERRTAGSVPAPAMVALFSPNVVSNAVHRFG